MNKLSIRIIAILSLLLSAANVQSQNAGIGQWQIYSSFSIPPQRVIETDNDKVYYVSGGNLFSYDNKTDESYGYNTSNLLTENGITDIYYNYDRKYLFIAYESGNIDLLYDNGRKVNMSDIKDSNIVPPLTINDVCFSGDTILVATTFGLVEFNEPRAEVIQSANWGEPVYAVCIYNDQIFVFLNVQLSRIPRNHRIADKDNLISVYKFGHSKNINAKEMFQWDEGHLVFVLDWQPHVSYMEIDDQYQVTRYRSISNRHDMYPRLNHGQEGKIYYCVDSALFTITPELKELKLGDLPYKDAYVGTRNGLESVWSLTNDGLAHHSLDGQGGVTVEMERFKPEQLTVNNIGYFYPSNDSKYLYMRNPGATYHKFGVSSDFVGYRRQHTASQIDLHTGSLKDETPYPVVTKQNTTPNSGIGPYLTSISGLVIDPDDPSRHYVSSTREGVFLIKDCQVIGKYDETNTPIVTYDGRQICYGINIDRGGNLWVARNANNYSYSCMMVLPADKRRLDPKEVTAEDWIIIDMPSVDYWGGHESIFYNCQKSNLILISNVAGSDIVLAYDTRGTFNDFSDDQMYLWEEITDQDGKKYSSLRQNCIVEDLNGQIWIGTWEGLFVVSNQSKLLDPSMTFTHVKVPRNDGSGLADYLIGTDQVQSIAVDAANRKWIATQGSGLYLVSPDGSEILERFTPENSPLLSNQINCVYVDPNSSTVYVGTPYGLFTYGSDATPAKDTFDEVVAFPNPVRPDYGGDIYIKGLKDNSLVKIADSAGQVLYQGRSEGGLFTWSGMNSNGRRVPTGVYYVLLSDGDREGSDGAVAKIMVVN